MPAPDTIDFHAKFQKIRHSDAVLTVYPRMIESITATGLTIELESDDRSAPSVSAEGRSWPQAAEAFVVALEDAQMMSRDPSCTHVDGLYIVGVLQHAARIGIEWRIRYPSEHSVNCEIGLGDPGGETIVADDLLSALRIAEAQMAPKP